ncbi:DUF2207 family protein [Peptoniphilus sp.]|jgi:uncharacterized membrane protein|uniref:DUF2207 family protein n=1 Tax=Peptoniphilus sp. TaxID=1971214 RepID=UPI003D8EFD9A
MKKLYTSICTIFLVLIVITSNVFAEVNMHSIDLEVSLHSDGSASVKETRSFYTDEGTENFISLGNMGETELSDVKVYDESGNLLEKVESWDINKSREEKAHKYGVVDTGDGYEICFGFGDYGEHTFVTEYNLSNFVFNLKDNYQAFYWKFLNDGMNPTERASVRVYNDAGLVYSYPSTRIWGFGYTGKTEINNDNLYAYTEEPMSSSNYMVLLGIFEGKIFNTSNNQNWTSDELIDEAMVGASPSDGNGGNSTNARASEDNYYDDSQGTSSRHPFFGFIFWPFFSVIFNIIIVFIIFQFIRNINKGSEDIKGRTIDMEELPYYRDIPDEDFARTYRLVYPEMEDVLSAYILKWVFEKKLKERKDEVGLIFKRDSLSLIIGDKGEFDNTAEEDLWDMIVSASGDDNILSEKEFTKYIKKHYDEYSDLQETLSKNSKRYIKSIGGYEVIEKKVLGIFKREKTYETDVAYELKKKVFGFKKYLEDYSLLSEREVKEVSLWKDYLIWAAYFGIADKVYEQLKIVDPGYDINGMDMTTFIILTNNFSSNVQSAYNSATSSSSSGGGGSSFSGGGGGSFGGGSGGGIR